MSTRAAYFFVDGEGHHMVYKHHDGYPVGAVQWLQGARQLAWSGDRFEADEAAASFVAAAKLLGNSRIELSQSGDIRLGANAKNDGHNGGGVRLMHKSEDPKNLFAACKQCCDIEFAYVVEVGNGGDWKITIYGTSFYDDQAKKNATKLWSGPLSKMSDWAKKAKL